MTYRVYTMTRIAADGDRPTRWIAQSNDGETLWRLTKEDDGWAADRLLHDSFYFDPVGRMPIVERDRLGRVDYIRTGTFWHDDTDDSGHTMYERVADAYPTRDALLDDLLAEVDELPGERPSESVVRRLMGGR